MCLSIGSIEHFLCIRKKTRMVVYDVLMTIIFASTKNSGINTIFNSYVLITIVTRHFSTKLS